MELDLRIRVEAPASAVWALLTDPPRMNRWSTAHIDIVSPGEGQSPAGIGALRRVTVPGPVKSRLLEVVRAAESPSRFVYNVVGGVLGLREHEGVITLTPVSPLITEVRWRVRMSFAIPGLGALTRRLIEPELQRSLQTLARVGRGAAEVPFTPPRLLLPVDLAPLRREAERVLGEQREIAERLAAAGDPKQWFAYVYVLVTEEQLAHLDRGLVDHPEWVLRLLPRFHAYYTDNLARFVRDPASAEEPWRKAWSCAESGDPLRTPLRVVKGLLLGVAAHIESDLPRALAEVYCQHFQDRCDYVRFRADYLRMAGIFQVASDRLMLRMPRAFLPRWLRLARKALPPELQDPLMRRYYDVPRRRLAAFERGYELARSVP